MFWFTLLLACSDSPQQKTSPKEPTAQNTPKKEPTKDAVKTASKKDTQTAAKTETTTQTGSETTTETATKTETETATKTETETKTATKTETETKTATKTETETKTDVKAEEKAVVKAEEKQVETTTEATTETKPPAKTSHYSVGSNNSSLSIRVYKGDTLAKGLAHNHLVLAKGWSGKISWHPTDASKCKVSISVPVSKLSVDPPRARKSAGFKGEVSEGQRKDIKKNMLAKGQLNAAAHKNITFESSSCDGTSGTVNVKGTFTLRGKSRNISIPLKVKLEPKFSAKASFNIKATDYGFKPYSAAFGAVKNKNKMKIKARFKP